MLLLTSLFVCGVDCLPASAQPSCLPNYGVQFVGALENDAHFGKSVSTAGDINGDGLADIIIGAPDTDLDGLDRGWCELFESNGDGSWSFAGSFLGDQDFGNVGNSVGTAGDVNGDGYDDIIVGAYNYTNGESGEGRVYLWYGVPSGYPIGVTPDWMEELDLAGALFGTSVATAGDVNGDGYADVVIGARGVGGGILGNESGAAYIFFGSPSGLSSTYDEVVYGLTESARFGSSVATAGDVNGDGYDDVIVGAPGFDALGDTANDNGKAFVYYGSPTGISTTPDWSVTGGLGSQLGYSVFTAGDVNGDGYADVIVGAPTRLDGSFAPVGEADVYLGGASGLATSPVWTKLGAVSGERYGFAVSTAGDIDGDGFADIIVGIPWVGNDQGQIKVYFGSAAGPLSSPCTRTSGQLGSHFGAAVCTAGDVDGDGYSEIIVGEYNRDLSNPSYTGAGAVWVYTGGQRLPSESPGWIASDGTDTDNGHAASTAGDVNGDGYSDVIVGAPNYSNFMSGHGRARVYLGTAYGLSTSPSWSNSQSGTSSYGASVSLAGDVNGDGYTDVLVGDPDFDAGLGYEGKVFEFDGGPSGLSSTPSWSKVGDAQYSDFGYAVSDAGDVDGDGYGDVLIGAFGVGSSTAYLFRGSASGLETTPSWFVSRQNVGGTVSGAGDVNADGYSDVIIGNYATLSSFGDYRGVAMVYLGSSTGLQDSPQAYCWLSSPTTYLIAVDSAGDLNGDGYSDIVLGGESLDGIVQVHLGGPSGIDENEAWSRLGASGENLGYSVGYAGDVNGDGYSDIIVGSPRYTGNQQYEGKVTVFFGTPSNFPPIGNEWFFDSDQANAEMGKVVATSGDVNGDGFADLLVAKWGFDQIFLHPGNQGNGLPRIPRQAQYDGSAPIDLLGAANVQTAWNLRALGRCPAGRTKLRMEYELKPVGVAFDGSIQVGAYTDTGAPVNPDGSAVALEQPVTGAVSETAYHWRLRFRSRSPYFEYSPWIGLPYNSLTETDLRTALAGTAATPVAATQFWFAPPSPNPFGGRTTLGYRLPRAGKVCLEIFDVRGRRVATLVDETEELGEHRISWTGRDDRGASLASGTYFARLQIPGTVQTRRITLLR